VNPELRRLHSTSITFWKDRVREALALDDAGWRALSHTMARSSEQQAEQSSADHAALFEEAINSVAGFGGYADLK
jgi:hypothetical protein